ncbi:AAA family ATPase (plasmid) [Aliivibrio salmonicida]|uniref:AAA family ATPase n=1 Tax=Aliivibrio salmonicida TaxID=40269 RepID=UPI000F6B4B43|nr:AAA family ATPase [Aliivibrio salmonicida]AZL83402.1 AAA family ATPase [Aliivibrio salmonicida]
MSEYIKKFSVANTEKLKRSNTLTDIFYGLSLGEVGFIIGPPDVGKSYLSLSLAYEAALGCPIIGISPKSNTQFKVIYAPYEDRISTCFERISEQLHNFSEQQINVLEENLAFYTNDSAIASPQFRNNNASNSVEHLIEAAKGYDLLIIDTIRFAIGAAGEVQDDSQIKMTIYEIARKANVAILINHHLTKSQGKKGGDEVNSTGGSGLSTLQSQSKFHLFLNKKLNKLELVHSKGNYIDSSNRIDASKPLILTFSNKLLISNRSAVQSTAFQAQTVKQDISSDLMGVEKKIENDNLRALDLINRIPTDNPSDDNTFDEILSQPKKPNSEVQPDIFDEMFIR